MVIAAVKSIYQPTAIPNLPAGNNKNLPVGRFAPSPTGYLHLGSLVTAVASYCVAKQAGGNWLLRIEDVDTTRCKSIYSEQILRDLARLGLHWDGAVRYQSQHLADYHAYLDHALTAMSYGCQCSRKTIADYYQVHSITATRYPQLCVHQQLDRAYPIRLIMPDQTMAFFDHLQGVIFGNPQRDHGDIVVRRRSQTKYLGEYDGIINYMLAVVVDDALQGINHIVRGLDILPLTLPQMVIANYLKFPSMQSYYHLPILVNKLGQKLSKQTLAEPVYHQAPQPLLKQALRLLHQPDVAIDEPEKMLQQAVAQWDIRPLQGLKQINL